MFGIIVFVGYELTGICNRKILDIDGVVIW